MRNPLTIRNSRGPSHESQIIALEKLVGANLPKAYRDFLSQYNGGDPTPHCFRYRDNVTGEANAWVDRFFSIGDDRDFNTINYHIRHYKAQMPTGFLPIAYDGSSSTIYLSLNIRDMGKVYLSIDWIAPSDGNIFLVSDDFDSFIHILEDCPKDEEDMIESEEDYVT